MLRKSQIFNLAQIATRATQKMKLTSSVNNDANIEAETENNSNKDKYSKPDIGTITKHFCSLEYGLYTSLTLVRENHTYLNSIARYKKGCLRCFGTEAKKEEKKEEKKPQRPACADADKREPPVKVCPPKKWSTGCCCRVTMPGCKKSCQFQRDFCCKKAARPLIEGCRIHTPYPSYVECNKGPFVLRFNPECDCHLPQSPCPADQRIRVVPEPTLTCACAAN